MGSRLSLGRSSSSEVSPLTGAGVQNGHAKRKPHHDLHKAHLPGGSPSAPRSGTLTARLCFSPPSAAPAPRGSVRQAAPPIYSGSPPPPRALSSASATSTHLELSPHCTWARAVPQTAQQREGPGTLGTFSGAESRAPCWGKAAVRSGLLPKASTLNKRST